MSEELITYRLFPLGSWFQTQYFLFPKEETEKYLTCTTAEHHVPQDTNFKLADVNAINKFPKNQKSSPSAATTLSSNNIVLLHLVLLFQISSFQMQMHYYSVTRKYPN